MKAVNPMLYLFLAMCGLAYAQEQPDTRASTIDSARNEKEANLSPETAPKAELRIESIESSVPYKLLTGELDGFGVGFSNIVPGSGFAFGPQYTRGFLDGQLTLRVQARVATNESYLGRFDVSMPHLFNDHAFLDFTTSHRDISEMPYYGPGPDSRKTGRSDYRLEDTNVEVRPGVRIFKGLQANLVGSFLAVNVGPGHSSNYISSDRQFGPDVTPGIDRQTSFWRGGARVAYDWRDDADSPTSGGRYSAQYVRYLDAYLGRYSFLRLDMDAAQYIPLFNHTRVIALHAATSLTTTNSTQQVPFYLQPTLGGPDNLRGYGFDRFYGNNLTMVNAEYRWAASPTLQMVIFADGGKVFDQWQQWNYHRLQSDVGFGFRFHGRSKTIFSFDTGFSHEGFQIWFRMNSAT